LTVSGPSELPPRHVTLVLCTPNGDVLGALPPYDVALPYWQETADVIAGAKALYGADVTVLRLLHVEREQTRDGGPVTYLAQVDEPPVLELAPWSGDPNADEPLRQQWARPGGPQADLSWAEWVLADRGSPLTAPAEQVRTWNLSSLWRLPTGGGAAWLKVVPPFFAHEGAMLERLPLNVVPTVIATDGPRILLDEVAGEDQYFAPLARLVRMVPLLVGLQVQWADRVDELLGMGLPDWRHPSLAVMVEQAIARTAAQLDVETVAELADLTAGLGDRFAAVARCGIPDSLVHGDFHPGNVRGGDERLVLLDWGDCGVGNPLFDQAAFVERLSPTGRTAVQSLWSQLWRDAVPGCDPDQAAQLLEPVAALRQAVIYDVFLAAIEPDERVYHAADPAAWLRRAAKTSNRV
jgi:hypothetical protein